MKSLCVFCGSSIGKKPVYAEFATAMGERIARENCRLVYGGGDIGLMGAVADATMHNGGEVLGVIPSFLADREVAHDSITKLVVVESMHARKQLMADESDAFIALPGGFGTLDELCEILTWAQLDLHSKPIALLNPDGYFDPFIAFVDHMVSEGFVHEKTKSLLIVCNTVDQAWKQLSSRARPDAKISIERL